MEVTLEPGWKKKLNEELQKPYFHELLDFIDQEYNARECFPSAENIFKAFEFSPFEKTKVVIIGQDPYHGYGQAHGLCFSVQPGTKVPPSLVNIFKELEADLGIPIQKEGNLEHWAKQGILMLNATLTVESGQPNSHERSGW